MTPAAIKPIVSADDLDKIDIRVGTIVAVYDMVATDHLVKLLVNFGDHQRSIVVGMKKERVDPRTEIEGKQALFVINRRAEWQVNCLRECFSISVMPTR